MVLKLRATYRHMELGTIFGYSTTVDSMNANCE